LLIPSESIQLLREAAVGPQRWNWPGPFVEGGGANAWDSIVCRKCEGHRRARPRITDLSVDVLSWTVVDFSRTMLGDIVMAEHARDVLSTAKLSGFAVKPVTLETYPAGL
jgi:hypothetical protein